MFISASGALTAMYRQDVLSNNLANLETVGYKPEVSVTRQRGVVRDEDGLEDFPSNALLERLKGGVLLMPNRVDFTQGVLQTTSSPYDLAIRGEGFFRIQGDEGERLSRDGRFTKSRDGLLVNGEGRAVLDDSGGTIQIPDGPAVRILGDGTILQDGRAIARLGVVQPEETSDLTKEGHGLFRVNETAPAPRSARGEVVQFHVEQASVDEIQMIMQITGASREVESNIGMLHQAHRLNDLLINIFGRVT